MSNTIIRGGTIRVAATPQPHAHWEHFYHATAANLGGGVTAWMPDMLSHIRFKTISTAETIKVQGTKDGTNYTDLTPIDESTGLPFASVNLTSGSYRLPNKTYGQFRQFKFIKSGSTNPGHVVFVVVRSKPPGAGY
jgi:hypothetical protein